MGELAAEFYPSVLGKTCYQVEKIASFRKICHYVLETVGLQDGPTLLWNVNKGSRGYPIDRVSSDDLE